MFLDTTFCIDLMREWRREQTGRAMQKLMALANTPLELPFHVMCELRTGAKLSGKPTDELRRIERLSDVVPIAYPDRSFFVMYGTVASALRQTGTPISQMDLLIGVEALCRGSSIVTRDMEHYSLIPGLVVESY